MCIRDSHPAVGTVNKLVMARQFHGGDVRQPPARAQPFFLVQHTAQKIRRVEHTLHAVSYTHLATEDQQRGKLEQRAEDDALTRKAAPRGIGELRQESKEKQRHLGVGDVHDHPSPVQCAVSGELRLLERSL